MLEQFVRISQFVECAHTLDEMLEVSGAILRLPRGTPGVIVEAGAFKGGSAAKLSLAAKLAGRKLIIFDSFEGIPPNSEVQRTKEESNVIFKSGDYAGSLELVKAAIAKYGAPEVCEFAKGWFSNTMPSFHEPVAVGYLDVDLVLSTRDCLKNLYPLLVPEGTLFSQDGHLSGVQELLADEDFWQTVLNSQKPKVRGLGRKKLVAISRS